MQTEKMVDTKEQFVTAFSNLLDVGCKIFEAEGSRRPNPLLLALKDYAKIWEKTKEGPSKHMELVGSLSVTLGKFIRSQDSKGEITEKVRELCAHLANPGKGGYKIVPQGGKSRAAIYISSIVVSATRLTESDQLDPAAQERVYLDIFVLELLRACQAVDAKTNYGIYTGVIEGNLGIAKGATIETDDILSSLKSFAREITGQDLESKQVKEGFQSMIQNRDMIENFKTMFKECTNAPTPAGMVNKLLTKMSSTPFPPAVAESLRAMADSIPASLEEGYKDPSPEKGGKSEKKIPSETLTPAVS